MFVKAVPRSKSRNPKKGRHASLNPPARFSMPPRGYVHRGTSLERTCHQKGILPGGKVEAEIPGDACLFFANTYFG